LAAAAEGLLEAQGNRPGLPPLIGEISEIRGIVFVLQELLKNDYLS
jgi:hypothetical protein